MFLLYVPSDQYDMKSTELSSGSNAQVMLMLLLTEPRFLTPF